MLAFRKTIGPEGYGRIHTGTADSHRGTDALTFDGLKWSGGLNVVLFDELVAVAGDHRLEFGKVAFGGDGKVGALIGDPADKHGLVAFEGHGDDSFVVQVAVIDAGADRVTVETDDEVEDRGAVGDVDLLGGVLWAHGLLREVEAALLALLVLDERVWVQVMHAHGTFGRQRVVARDEDVQRGAEKRVKLQVLGPQQFAYHVLVEIGQVQQAEVGLHVGDLVDDVAGSRLPDGELVLVGFDRIDHLHERLDREHVVLRGDGAQLFARLGVLVTLLHELGLIEYLPGVREEFGAIDRQCDALRGAGEDLDAHLVLQLLDR